MYVRMYVIHTTCMYLCMLYTSFTRQSKTIVYIAYITNHQLISCNTSNRSSSIPACINSVYMAGRPTYKMLIQSISLFCHKHASSN